MANIISEHLSREVASDIKLLLRDFRKLLKVLTLYPDDNPLPVKMRQSFGDHFTELVEIYGGFLFVIRPNEIVYNHEVVYQDQGKDETLAAIFYNAGIIQLEFRDGLPLPEFNAFLDLVGTYLKDPSQDQDLVAMIWLEQFSHIKFKTVEDLALNEFQTETMIREMYAGYGNFENPKIDLDRIVEESDSGAENGSAPGSTSLAAEIVEDGRQMGLDLSTIAEEVQPSIEQLLSSSYVPAEEELRELEQLLEEDRNFDPIGTVTRITIEILHFWDDPEPFAEALDIYRKILDQLLKRGDFAMAADLIYALRELRQEMGGSKPANAKLLKDLIARIGDSSYIRKLSDIINRQSIINRAAIEIYLDALGLEALVPITGMLGHLVSREARLTVCDFLAKRGKDYINIIAGGLYDERWYVVRNTVLILGRIGGQGVIPHLTGVARHEDQRVRHEVILALRANASDRAIEVMFEFLRDPEPDLRRIALNNLKKAGGARSFEIVKDIVHSPDFAAYPLNEQAQFLAVYSYLGGTDAIAFLYSMIQSFSLFGFGRKARYRVMALRALAYNSSPEAEDVLLKYTGVRRAWLREAAVSALGQRRLLFDPEKVES